MIARAAKAWGTQMQREPDMFTSEAGVLHKWLREGMLGSDPGASCELEPMLASAFCSGPALSAQQPCGVPGTELARPCKPRFSNYPAKLRTS